MQKDNHYWHEKKPSMKRRMEGHDYTERNIYMLTLVVEGRKPLLGKVAGDPNAPSGSDEGPCFVPSPLGLIISREVELIASHYPQVRVLGRQLMPDHLHFILFVTEKLPVPLGKIVNGFKTGCRKAMREVAITPLSGAKRNTAIPDTGTEGAKRHTAIQNTGIEGAKRNTAIPDAGTEGAKLGITKELSVTNGRNDVGGVAFPAAEQQEKAGVLFEHGYHDRVLSGEGQLQKMIDYIHDNPRRLLLKRIHSEWLRPCFGVSIAGRNYASIGNLRLLSRRCVQVRVSRRCSEQQISQDVDSYLKMARNGAVLVSPSISPGEKRVMRAAFDAKLPVVVLVENGFTEYSKPHGEQFDACADGRLLLLAPWEHHMEKRQLTAFHCQQLNLMAGEICDSSNVNNSL
jgi:hypothetical protein